MNSRIGGQDRNQTGRAVAGFVVDAAQTKAGALAIVERIKKAAGKPPTCARILIDDPEVCGEAVGYCVSVEWDEGDQFCEVWARDVEAATTVRA